MSIVLDHLVKGYDGHLVVNHVSIEVADREFFVLLGPSGSGKSTVLRLIAGLAEPDAGHVLLHGRDVTQLPPQKRGVGFVFQHYALFRHMTVAENIEFALRIRKISGGDRKRRRAELLELVGLVGLDARFPHQLSGGQQQRVALARALAHQPEVLLLDEPFGALDARIRIDLRRTLRKIQKELGVTTLFVTHDQEEAFELADRLGVMNFGRLLEIGPPNELYLRPQTEFVAGFLGKANLMVGVCSAEGVHLGPVRFPLATQEAEQGVSRRVQVLFRPEDVAVKDAPEALEWPLLGKAVVEEIDFSGSFERLRLRLPRLEGVRSISPPVPFGADHFVVEATRSQHLSRRFPLQAGDTAWVGVRRLHALTHPGLSFLVLTDGTAAGEATVDMAGAIARLAHARVTVLGIGMPEPLGAAHLQRVRERLGSGLAALEVLVSPDPPAEALAREATRREYDLIVEPRGPTGEVDQLEETLSTCSPHVLLATARPDVPKRLLIGVAVGEPGKEDVRFAGRLARHLGAEATLLTSIPPGSGDGATEQGERFLEAGIRTLALFGVEARSALRHGRPETAILEEVERGYDLLVLGAPGTERGGRVRLNGVVGDVVGAVRAVPILIVRSDTVIA